MTPDITSPDDLSFVTHDAEGARNDWNPPRDLASPEAGMRRGLAFVLHDLAELARIDEYEAYTAITQALTAATWDRDRAEEAGFVDGLARVAMIGMRALAATRPSAFDTDFDPQRAQWLSLHARGRVSPMGARRSIGSAPSLLAPHPASPTPSLPR